MSTEALLSERHPLLKNPIRVRLMIKLRMEIIFEGFCLTLGEHICAIRVYFQILIIVVSDLKDEKSHFSI